MAERLMKLATKYEIQASALTAPTDAFWIRPVANIRNFEDRGADPQLWQSGSI
jgi:hypothetical protein